MTVLEDHPYIEEVGDNFEEAFGVPTPPPGGKGIGAPQSSLISTPLEQPMTSDEILETLTASEVLIDDVYATLPDLDTSVNHLFFVKDANDITIAVLAFPENEKWKLVSPTSNQAGTYPLGTLIWTL